MTSTTTLRERIVAIADDLPEQGKHITKRREMQSKLLRIALDIVTLMDAQVELTREQDRLIASLTAERDDMQRQLDLARHPLESATPLWQPPPGYEATARSKASVRISNDATAGEVICDADERPVPASKRVRVTPPEDPAGDVVFGWIELTDDQQERIMSAVVTMLFDDDGPINDGLTPAVLERQGLPRIDGLNVTSRANVHAALEAAEIAGLVRRSGRKWIAVVK